MSRAERLDRLRLSALVEPGDARLAELLTEHEPGRVLEACRGGASLPGPPLPEPWRVRAAAGADSASEDLLADATVRGLRWVCPGEREWPARLDDLAHGEAVNGSRGRPVGLWARGGGRLNDLASVPVAVVGARDATSYGTEVAAGLGADLADAGSWVVSGAAFGIDAAAHRGALSMGGRTVAVLACGVDVDYPRAHGSLLGRIAQDGVVVSEQLPGQGPTKGRFLSRNRLIAALADGTVVVEAARRSGSLNTLNWAGTIGRVTMCVPGPVTSRASVGVHQALRDQRAVLVTTAEEVRELLAPLGTSRSDAAPSTSTAFDELQRGHRMVLETLPVDDPAPTEAVALRIGCTVEAAGLVLEDLADRGWVDRSDGQWSLARRADLSPPVP